MPFGLIEAGNVGIAMSAKDASDLAMALDSLQAIGAEYGRTLPQSLRVLLMELNRKLLAHSRRDLGMSELQEVHRKRRDWLADELKAEEELLAAGRAIRADLKPTADHPAVVAARESGTEPTPFINDAKDWSCDA